MTLIEGIGDEVTQFFIALFAIIIITLAWWTTNISEQRHVRTVFLLERRRHRAHRRLTNHTETVTIAEGTSQGAQVNIEQSSPSEEPSTSESSNPEDKQPDVAASVSSTEDSTDASQSSREAQSIIETMDSDTCVLRQRRLAFYDNWNNENRENSQSETISQPSELPHSSAEANREPLMEHNYAEHLNGTEASSSAPEVKKEKSQVGITIKLKYINDDLKLVHGQLDEQLGDFKKRHFQSELTANKLVRLIFNGQVLQPDTQTLASCGLFDNCVVHCLIHQKRTPNNESAVQESRREGYSFPNSIGVNLNNNNQNREWDLGNFLFAFISFILLAAWYFRYVYAHLYTVTATVGLILITGIFTIVLVGMYFPENEHLPNPMIRITRERVQPQQ